MFLAMSWCLQGWVWLLPPLTILWMTATFVTTYSVAVAKNHTFPDFPYISYTGIEEPESGIFTLGVSVTAIMLAANAEMRYLFLREVLEKVNERKSHWTRLNFAGLVLGLTASFGLLLVGCFQVDTMKPPHYIGAFLCFVVAIVYIWVQVALSFKLRRLYGENRTRERKIWKAFRWLVFIYQVLCGIAASILLVLFCVSKAAYKLQRKAHPEWTKWDVLRGVFLLSTSTEWLLAFSVMFFIQSFIPGFRRLRQININVSLEDSTRDEAYNQDGVQLQNDSTGLMNGDNSGVC